MTPLQTLLKKIDTLNDKAKAIQSEYQAVGVECLQHLSDHGDIGPVNRLYVGMPKGTRKTAMASWLMAHGALKVNTDKGTKETSPMAFDKNKKTDPEAAKADPWQDHAPERDIADTFDLQVALKSLLNRAQGKHLLIGGKAADEEGMALLRMLATGAGLPPPSTDKPVAANPSGINTTEPTDATAVRQSADGEASQTDAPARTSAKGTGSTKRQQTKAQAALV